MRIFFNSILKKQTKKAHAFYFLLTWRWLNEYLEISFLINCLFCLEYIYWCRYCQPWHILPRFFPFRIIIFLLFSMHLFDFHFIIILLSSVTSLIFHWFLLQTLPCLFHSSWLRYFFFPSIVALLSNADVKFDNWIFTFGRKNLCIETMLTMSCPLLLYLCSW